MKKLSFLFSVLFFSFLSQAAQKKLVIVGDSLSEGYGIAKQSTYASLLEEKLKADKKDYVVVNSSVSGSTSASAPSRVKWTLKSNPDVIFLALGANDALRGLPVGEVEKNLTEAIEMAKAAKVKVILGGVYAPPNYGKDYVDKFKAVYPKIAKKLNVPLVPFILEGVAGHSKLNLSDNMHPNEAGHKIMAEHIYKSIKDQL